MRLGTSSTFRQLRECGEQVETKEGEGGNAVWRFFLIRCSSGKYHLLASDGAVLGPDCCIASGKHISPLHDIMEARGTQARELPIDKPSRRNERPRLISAPINSSRLEDTGGLNLEYSVATLFFSAPWGME